MKVLIQFLFFFSVLTFGSPTLHSQKAITVEDIWTNSKYATNSVPGFNFMKDGRSYTLLEENRIDSYDLMSGKFSNIILDGDVVKGIDDFDGEISSYKFSDDENRVLISSQSEDIYRRSKKALVYVYDRSTLSLHAISKGNKISNASLSPDGSAVAYVLDNNLYIYSCTLKKSKAITDDGIKNQIINGMSDWVYEEEFGFTKAFFWSPDSKKIAYLRFDEREVPEFTMTEHHDELYPEYVTFKYPKVGQKNADVSVHLYNLSNGITIPADVGTMDDTYIPRLKWTKDPNVLCVFKMNRHQNELELLLTDAQQGASHRLLKEKNKYYIDITDDIRFLDNGKEFIWTSEKSGFNHIYLYDMKGNEKIALTSGEYDVLEFYGVDEKRDKVFYQSVEKSPLARHVYEVNLSGKNKKCLTPEDGSNSCQFSDTYDYYVNTHSTINDPATYIVYNKNGNKVRIIEDNSAAKKLQDEQGVQEATFFEFTTSENVKLNGWMILPPGLKENREYPVFMTQYSGPGSQSVTDKWKGNNYWWYQMLAQQGFIVACVDGRGTGGRGEEFKKMTYLQLGHYETLDQIEAAKYLGSLPFTDASRIGIFGWSYGGYMSSLCILKGNDVFKAAIAVAPVTSWKWYDTIYTERYMRTLAENSSGYRENSPIYFADRLKGDYLLVHGDADDNVHFQNTVEMTRALIEANKQFDTYFYPNRKHGISGDNARRHLYTKMTNFLQEKLQRKERSENRP